MDSLSFVCFIIKLSESADTEMKGYDYHSELDPIYGDIITSLKEEQDVAPQQLELEFKHGFLKNSNYNKWEFQMLENTSQLRPVVMNLNQTYRKFKVNAGCDKASFQNAKANLESITKRTGCKVDENYMLFINWLEQRFCFDCSTKKWTRVDKVQLFSQCNVISKKKLFRVNFTCKTEYGDVQEIVKQLSIKEWTTGRPFMRFKHSLIYHIDRDYFIECNTTYESESENDYLLIEKAIQQGSDIASQVKQKIKEKQTRTELQLKISPEGIESLRKGSEEKQKMLVSRAFDQLRDITNKPAEQDIIKMMQNLNIKTKQEEKIVEKVEQKQISEDEPPKRREYRKREQ